MYETFPPSLFVDRSSFIHKKRNLQIHALYQIKYKCKCYTILSCTIGVMTPSCKDDDDDDDDDDDTILKT